jgi:hypothetical protein
MAYAALYEDDSDFDDEYAEVLSSGISVHQQATARKSKTMFHIQHLKNLISKSPLNRKGNLPKL